MATPKEHIGSRRKLHPWPMRLRNPFIPRELGGAEGWRGPGWRTIRQKVLARDKNRSTVSGFGPSNDVKLQVDHIQPFRYGGKNRMSNLRTTDYLYGPYLDLARGDWVKKPQRRKGL